MARAARCSSVLYRLVCVGAVPRRPAWHHPSATPPLSALVSPVLLTLCACRYAGVRAPIASAVIRIMSARRRRAVATRVATNYHESEEECASGAARLLPLLLARRTRRTAPHTLHLLSRSARARPANACLLGQRGAACCSASRARIIRRRRRPIWRARGQAAPPGRSRGDAAARGGGTAPAPPCVEPRLW